MEECALRSQRFAVEFGGTRWSLKSNPPIAGWQWRHGGADSVHEVLNLTIMDLDSCFELRELRHHLLVYYERLAHLNEGAHHEDAHCDSAFRVQNGRGHNGAVLWERVRQIAAATMNRT